MHLFSLLTLLCGRLGFKCYVVALLSWHVGALLMGQDPVVLGSVQKWNKKRRSCLKELTV